MTKKAIQMLSIGVLSLLAVLLYFLFSPEKYELFFPKCPIYKGLGIYCTGCGSQRALHDIFHFKFGDAFSHNVLLIPTLLVLAVHLCLRIVHPSKLTFLQKRKAPLIALTLLILFTVLRNIDMEPFRYLAP